MSRRTEDIFLDIMTQLYDFRNVENLKEYEFNDYDCYKSLRYWCSCKDGKLDIDEIVDPWEDVNETVVLYVRNNLITNLMSIIHDECIEIIPITDLDFKVFCLLNICMKNKFEMLNLEIPHQLVYEDVLIFQLINSINARRPELLASVRAYENPLPFKFDYNIKGVDTSTEFMYPMIRKILFLACKSEGNLQSLKLNNYSHYSEHFEIVYGMQHTHIQMAKYYSDEFVESTKNLFKHSTYIYVLMDTLRYLLYKYSEMARPNGVNEGMSLEDNIGLTCASLNGVIDSYFCRAVYRSTEVDELEVYNEYLQDLYTSSKEMDKAVFEACQDRYQRDKSERMEQVRLLKLRVKELQRLIHEKKQECLKKEELKKQSEDYIEPIAEDNEKELIVSQMINIQDKLSILASKKILIMSCIELESDKLTKNIDIEDANQFRGKSINKKYDYVVKVIQGMTHGITYDINSELRKTNAKLITSSHRNINLILDDIIEQM